MLAQCLAHSRCSALVAPPCPCWSLGRPTSRCQGTVPLPLMNEVGEQNPHSHGASEIPLRSLLQVWGQTCELTWWIRAERRSRPAGREAGTIEETWQEVSRLNPSTWQTAGYGRVGEAPRPGGIHWSVVGRAVVERKVGRHGSPEGAEGRHRDGEWYLGKTVPCPWFLGEGSVVSTSEQ